MLTPFLIFLAWILGFFQFMQPVFPASSPAEEQALYWAPVIYQQTDPRLPKADYITRFDFDGDFDGWNNWENLQKFPLQAAVYYHVAETENLLFIYYGIFHPRDWEPGFDNPLSSHENDLEDLLLVIHKDGSPRGRLLLLETQAHFDFHAYAAARLKSRSTPIEGPLPLAGQSPRILIPPGGHGNYGLYSTRPEGSGILYQAAEQAAVPQGPDSFQKICNYRLLPFDELWQRRNQTGPGTPYRRFGEFGANDYTWLNAASAPWVHDDQNDGPVWPGDIFADPDYAVHQHVSGLPASSENYLQAPLYTHRLEIQALRILRPVEAPRLEVWQKETLLWSVPLNHQSAEYWQLPIQTRYFSLAPGGLKLKLTNQNQELSSFEFPTENSPMAWYGKDSFWFQASLKLKP
ncbi:hypothetical protein COW36_07780 [bacterium (Candidatus Blackallbacteria) CG17_big_fil_post_rev_8_21_14_2_50_48_46]|uniref:Uncharacterized protein n=1 Tax=bacterium (Candidatus Blackallbacteria) CG17_big_fil_post_rev_8_21_14_2_50_48_46 TaxID=2014261 RepID=A0A2M7G6T3_9BACT|nr:MAG: hypothetical protein COW64_06485 [bacterium (Candidatus Blackallbacteria) CG18_big_fil_WC_8_21_14_2_50_49_26]PIW17738.1 MAG: hypothetical protein COW36_07780 [bacterium (Candidatus Blackallbacteria) CG17_big_fil_post_rev_8_21_14_2_50_48_46]PIW47766.1 MAG: hypothetical protein COW20_11340 [bacterium (Candidatus Blackallbacteria) CG13_big_fil_rev_8_21_14_2_50_49_14]